MTAVVSLYECGEREKQKQDMLLSDTAPDAQKHDVISSPTDTFGVISSGAVSAAAAGGQTRDRQDALAHTRLIAHGDLQLSNLAAPHQKRVRNSFISAQRLVNNNGTRPGDI